MARAGFATFSKRLDKCFTWRGFDREMRPFERLFGGSRLRRCSDLQT
ncbi:hypothetical protein SAMN05216207_105213 [Pseudonocardia ammonioxydans]|uniref:Uncharacterized protein n=1 Tax=Pseudonocardia ammonioxydans TaxID=260086 RepID=A0A1I5GX03_PSUAM|nr:hypothetical protein SAMN05216207_105213 [Pseudonocardia ammonioxydans]